MKMNGLVYKQDVVNIFYNRAETADSDEEEILAELLGGPVVESDGGQTV